MIRRGEASSSDKAASETYKEEFRELTKAEEYVTQQVFNCEEMALLEEDAEQNLYHSEEKDTEDHKPMKDQLALCCVQCKC